MEKSKTMCRGCHNDIYNARPGGCWSFADAEVVERIQVGIWESPPYVAEGRVQEYLWCYYPEGGAMLHLEDGRVVRNADEAKRWLERVEKRRDVVWKSMQENATLQGEDLGGVSDG